MKVLFFSRGRGRGHAIPDVAIAKELSDLEPGITLQFVSYGTGAQTIGQCGYRVIDLKLPDDNPFLETLVRSIHIINEQEPSLVLSHEEFCVLPAAKLFEVPCMFLTDWFPSPGTVWMECLPYAEKVIFLDEPGYFEEPEVLKGKVEYVGLAIRQLSLTKESQHTARMELGLPQGAPIILILPGGASASSEDRAPLFDLVTSAIDLLDGDPVAVWVLPPEEQEKIRKHQTCRPDIVFMSPHFNVEKTMVAADVAITKATRTTSFELNALGIPSISISYGLNPIDDYRVAQIKTNRALRARGLTATSLSAHLTQAMKERAAGTVMLRNPARGRLATVAIIRHRLKAISEDR